MKKAVTITGIFIIVYMLLSCLMTNFASGSLLALIMGLSMALWFHVPDNMVIRICKVFLIITSIFFIIMIALISLIPHADKADYTEEAVIVLGCGVNGTTPTDSLVRRMDKGIDYYNNNNKALIVLSGGQGSQEDISEAQAMYNYMTEKGIPAKNIIIEDKATSTYENFKYSKEILDKKLGNDYRVVYITNNFHAYRAGRLARLNGLNVRSYSASPAPMSLLPCYLREVLAVLKLWIFKR